ISGVAFTTISPSSTNSKRSTPCVDGCCGPIEIVICVSSGRSTISNCGGMVGADDICIYELLPIADFQLPIFKSAIGDWKLAIISSYTVHNLAMENPCAMHVPANRPAAECGADPDGRQKSHQTDQTSRARASLQCARRRSQSVREHLPRSATPSTERDDI